MLNTSKIAPKTTDFGYQQVPATEKATKVAAVFDSVADKYDLMNDLMSLGLHRLWKCFTCCLTGLKPGDSVLDLASGTGDLAFKLLDQVGEQGQVYVTDINSNMLQLARDRMTDRGKLKNINYLQINAESLPFPDNFFNCVTLGFGLRNFTDKAQALAEMQRVLIPGGYGLILEFSQANIPGLKTIYDAYSFSVLPKLGKWLANDAASYRYLVESIRMHPDQETLKQMLITAGFDNCDYHNLAGGIVAVHKGYKF